MEIFNNIMNNVILMYLKTQRKIVNALEKYDLPKLSEIAKSEYIFNS